MATILVCDDEEVLRGLIRATLGAGSYRLVEAADGNAALATARAERPDLIILDMMMPGRSGLEVLDEVRRDTALRRTPVLMLTARTQVSDREAATEAGADRYLSKPFSPAQLASVVAEMLDAEPAA